MLRHSYLLIAVSFAVLLILAACSRGAIDDSTAGSPVNTVLEHRELGSQEGINRARPRVNQALPVSTQAPLTTVEVVKILTPSVVQIVTEILAMGSFNQRRHDCPTCKFRRNEFEEKALPEESVHAV